MKKLGIGMLVGPLVLLMAACGGDESRPRPVYPDFINVQGDLTLKGENYVRGNLSNCAGAGPYADLVKGAPVLVSNKVGKPLAIGTIQYGVGTNVYRSRLDECTFRWRVPAVPRGVQYQIIVGRQEPRPATYYSLYLQKGAIAWDLPVPTTTTTTTFALSTG